MITQTEYFIRQRGCTTRFYHLTEGDRVKDEFVYTVGYSYSVRVRASTLQRWQKAGIEAWESAAKTGQTENEKTETMTKLGIIGVFITSVLVRTHAGVRISVHVLARCIWCPVSCVLRKIKLVRCFFSFFLKILILEIIADKGMMNPLR